MATNKQELSSDDLAQVLRELFTVQGKWYNIGLCLGLSPATLQNILSANQTTEVRLRNMLIQSINQGGLTWEKIAEALENVIVDSQVVARKIRAKYCTPVPQKGAGKRPLDNPIAGPSKVSLYHNYVYLLYNSIHFCTPCAV